MANKNEEAQDEETCQGMTNTARGIALLQEKWVLFIVRGLLEGPLGFNELSRRAQRVNTTTLSQRMELLEREGIVTKTIYANIPPRTSYELTEKGRSLQKVIESIAEWSEKYMTLPNSPGDQ